MTRGNKHNIENWIAGKMDHVHGLQSPRIYSKGPRTKILDSRIKTGTLKTENRQKAS